MENEWTDCDESCDHGGPIRFIRPGTLAEERENWTYSRRDLDAGSKGEDDLIRAVRGTSNPPYRIQARHHALDSEVPA